MNKNILTILSFLIATSAIAQAPEKLPYQGVVRDAGNNLIANTTLGVRITVLQGSSTGTPVYVETHSPITNDGGLFSFEIGSGTTSDDFSAIDWTNGPYYLKRQIDPAGGSTYTIEGTTQFLSVPYALHSKSAEKINDLGDGKLYMGNASNQAVQITPSGDATISNTGVVTIGSSTVGSAEIIDNSLTADDLGTSSVASDEIADGTITDADLNKSAIPLSGFAPATAPIDAGSQLISNLTDPVSNMDAATKAYMDAELLALEIELIEAGAFNPTDVDGNEYQVVIIGSQVWMAENLMTTKYNDGTSIPLVTDDVTWNSLTTPGYCWYNNDQATYGDIYGAKYNWYTVDAASNGNKNVCPTGWHVPSDAEWTTMKNYLIANGYNYDGTTTGNKIGKSMASASGWDFSSTEGAVGNTDYPTFRNKTGFTALPGGYRTSSTTFGLLGRYNGWWSTGENGTDGGRLQSLVDGRVDLLSDLHGKGYGHSIRCIRD